MYSEKLLMLTVISKGFFEIFVAKGDTGFFFFEK